MLSTEADNILLDLKNSSHHTQPHPNSLCTDPPSVCVHRLSEMSFFNDVEPTIISKHHKQPNSTLDFTAFGLPRSALTKVKYGYESYKSDKGQLCF